MLHLLVLHVLIGLDEFLAQHGLERLGVVQLVERLIEADRQRVRIAIGRALTGSDGLMRSTMPR